MAADYPDLTIIEQNEAHEKLSMKSRENVVGKKLLDAYPDTSAQYKKTGKSELAESIQRAIQTGEPDDMASMRYDLQDEQGNWLVRHWKVSHYPIKENGKVVAVYQETKDISDEVKIERQLEQAQTKLYDVLSTGQVGTWSMDIARSIATGGPNLSRMFGMDEKIVGKGVPLRQFLNRIHPEDRTRVQAEIADAVISGGLYESEYRIIHDGTKVRWVLARGRNRVDTLDGSSIFSGTLVDITDRKERERILKESEARLRFMADSMPQLVWITRADGYHEYYNQRWHEYTGTGAGTTDGEGWKDLFHPDDQARAAKIWQHSLKTGEPYEIQYRLYHAPTDRYRWVIGRAMPFRDEDGTVVKWYGTCTDVDEQVHHSNQQTFLSGVSKELVKGLDQRKILAQITKLSVPAIADWCSVDLYSEENGFEQVSLAHADPKKLRIAREYRKHNPLSIGDDTAISQMLLTGEPVHYPVITDKMIDAYVGDEVTKKFMKGLNLSSIMIIPVKQAEETIGAMSFVSTDSGRRFSEEDFAMANELGARLSLSITNAKMYHDSLRDVNRRQELEKQLRQEKQTLESRVKERTAQLRLTNKGLLEEIEKRQAAELELSSYSEELARSNKELEDFAYIASHDLQEPLRKIQAFGNLLLSEYGDALSLEGADYLKRMHSAANRMSTLIEDLLTFSRVSRKRSPSRIVDLNKVLDDVRSDLETRITDTGATIKTGKMPLVSADPTHMRQLFQNIIGNAMKFHKAGLPPVVTITSKAKNDGYEICVSDNGIGFEEKYLDRIFAVFQRLHERSKYEGTGIGLAVCRKIVERYGGTITAKSTKDHGSTFIVWLPKTKDKKGK